MNNARIPMRPHRFLVLSLSLVLGPFCPLVQAQEATPQSARMSLTLDQAMTLALAQNRDVLVADKDRAKAEAQISEARSGALPTVTITANYTRNFYLPVLFIPPNTPFNPSSSTMAFEMGSDNAYGLGVQVSQALLNWKVGVALDIAHTYHDYTEQSYRATTQDVVLAVKKAFYGVMLARRLVEANRQGLDIVRANVENVRAQFRNGTAAEFDLLRAEVQLANTEPVLISAENNLVLATNGLKNLLAIPLETEIDVVGDFASDDLPRVVLDQGRRDALTGNPVIASLSFQESMLEKNISVERAGSFPTLNLIGAYQYQTQANTFKFNNYLWAKSLYVGINMAFPVFEGFKTSARIEQASIEREKIHEVRLKVEVGLRIQVQSCELRMAEARKRIEGQQRNIEQAEKAVRIAQTRYRSGVGTQLELLDAQVAMTRTKTNHAQAMYDFVVAKADWTNAVGQSR